MFIGHWAPALVAATHPKAPRLGTLFVAGQLVDWGFFGLTLLGVEKMRVVPGTTVMNPLDFYWMPFTHSLVGTLIWATAFGLLFFGITRNRTGALIAAAVVASHWFLDLLVHAPDLTLTGSPPKLGFALWNYPGIEMPLEAGLILGGLVFYCLRTRAISGQSRLALGLLLFLMITIQSINWFGPPPEHADAAMAITALAAYGLTTLAAWWVARTRVVIRPAATIP